MDWQQARPIVLATLRWCQVLSANGRGIPSADDAEHSALLRRLLAGKEPLPDPPPLADRYPWYALVDAGTDTATDVWDAGDGHLVIRQSRWKIIDRGETWWRVQWRGEGPVYRVEPTPQDTRGGTATAIKPTWKVRREAS